MFDTHESLAVRHTGQLIDEAMSGFIDAVMDIRVNLPPDVQHTPWYTLLSEDISKWQQSELDACYQYILGNHWKEKNVRPPIEVMYYFLYGAPPDAYDGENILKQWCEADDRHITFEDAEAWSRTDECQDLVQKYIEEENNDWTPLPNPSYNPDPLGDFGGSNDGGLYDEEEFYIPALNKTDDEAAYDFTEQWYFVVGQIKYIDSVAPGITTPLKVQWLRLALVSQPITEIFKKKKVYHANVMREHELVKTITA